MEAMEWHFLHYHIELIKISEGQTKNVPNLHSIHSGNLHITFLMLKNMIIFVIQNSNKNDIKYSKHDL